MNKGLDKYAAAIWAQEYFEIKHKRANFFKAITRNKEFLRDMEIRSHEIETQVAVMLGGDEKKYRAKEARAVVRYPQFKGSGIEASGIELAMLHKRAEALRFISKHKSKIMKARKYGS